MRKGQIHMFVDKMRRALGKATGASGWLKIWKNKAFKYRKIFLYPTLKDAGKEIAGTTLFNVVTYWGGRLVEAIW